MITKSPHYQSRVIEGNTDKLSLPAENNYAENIQKIENLNIPQMLILYFIINLELFFISINWFRKVSPLFLKYMTCFTV